MNVDAVEQGAADARTVTLNLCRRATALVLGVAQITTRTRF